MRVVESTRSNQTSFREHGSSRKSLWELYYCSEHDLPWRVCSLYHQADLNHSKGKSSQQTDCHSNPLIASSRLESVMWFPLGLSDLTLWTAIVAIILLITSEIFSPYYGRTEIMINRRRLRLVALIVAFIFLGTVAYRVYQIVITP